MRILIAPDSYKLTLDAVTAAQVIAEAARAVFPDAELDVCPLADGGEGSLEVWARATGAATTWVPGCDVFGEPLDCPVATDPAGGDVLIEAAHTCGLPAQPLRDPGRARSWGLGMALLAVLGRTPAARLRIALGGTGTVDGGLGAALALGMRLTGSDGRPLGLAGLLELPQDFSVSFCNPFLLPPEFLCDTRAPLLGPAGAVALFGPQKGVAPDRIRDYEAALERLMQAAARSVGRPFADAPGFGAAGGIAALFSLLCSATCASGAEYLLNAVKFAHRASSADLVVTGEGCLDEASFSGKIVGEIARVCRTTKRPLLVLAGRSRLSRERCPGHLAVRATAADGGPDPTPNMAKALLYDTGHSAFLDFLKKQLFPRLDFC
jgi:glycerate kinase